MSKSVTYDTTIVLTLSIKGRSRKSEEDEYSFMENFYIKTMESMGKALMQTNIGTVKKYSELKVRKNK